MMKNSTYPWVFLGAVTTGLLVAACTTDIHGNTVNINADLAVKADVDVSNVPPGSQIPLELMVQGVFLIEPSQTPPPEHAMDAGHIEIHLDDESTPPILITAQVKVSVTIASMTKPGHHKLLCRVHKHDGTPTTTSFSIDINVSGTITTGTPDSGMAGAPDAGMAGGMDAAMNDTGGAPDTGIIYPDANM